MRILQLCKKFPYPLKDGESIAVTYLASALHGLGCKITLLVMNTHKHYFDITQLPSDFNHYEAIHSVKIDNRVKINDAISNLFSKESYHVSRYISTEFDEKLQDLLTKNDFDIVQLETLYLTPYVDTIRKHSNARIAMRSHNVEFEIWERITKNTTFGLKKWYLSLLTKRLKTYEVAHLNNYDLLVAITQRDLDQFRSIGTRIKGHVCPIGLEIENYPQAVPPPIDFSIGFIGSLDWMPNLEGIDWFLTKVWDKIVAKYPQARLNIAGRNAPKELIEQKQQNVVVHGEVDNALDFMLQQQILIVPLFSGSGMRVKILESMALSRVTLTTTLGMEGITATPKENVLVADTADEFVQQITWCFENQSLAVELAQKGRQLILENYGHQQIAQNLLQTYQNQLIQA